MNKILTTFLASLFILTAVFSENNSEVKSRPSSDEVQNKIKKQVQQTQKHECSKKIQTEAFCDQYPPIYFPRSCHWLTAVLALDNSIILEDGSIWTFNSKNYSEVLCWKGSDPLLIYPNTSWFSSHNYKIVNQARDNSSIDVTLTNGPIIGGELSLQIVAIDYSQGEVYLSDNSRWVICGSDSFILDEWLEGDYIIIGSNNAWLCHLKNILINSNMYNHVRAQQF